MLICNSRSRLYSRSGILLDLFPPRQQMFYVRNDLLPHRNTQGMSSTDGVALTSSHYAGEPYRLSRAKNRDIWRR